MRKTMAYGLAVALVAMVFLIMPMSVSAEYTGTVTILADGTVVPADAPVTVNGLIYTLTDDIAGNIIIEMSGLTLDGAGHTISGTGLGNGIFGIGLTGVTIKCAVVMGFDLGIVLMFSDSCTIKENFVTDCVNAGIHLYGSDGNTIKENTCANNVWEGVWLDDSSNNIIKENEVYGNGEGGIFLWYGADNNMIKDNEAWDNAVMGILLWECNGNTVKENNVHDNTLGGIWLYYCAGGNTVEKNTISGCGWEAIRTHQTGGTMICGNHISTSRHGILIWFNTAGNGNIITGNTITRIRFRGCILSFYTYDNIVYHNNFKHNEVQALDNGVTNQWDYNGEGNYWSDYKGKDANKDGIGDTPYPIIGVAGSMDNFPLMKPWSE
jgi:parallel beta-helix repeat protein